MRCRMTNPQEQSVPEYIRELSYQVATAVEIGALAIGVGRHEAPGAEPAIIFEIAEVIAPGLGRYATSAQAEVLRTSYTGNDGREKPAISSDRQMFATFKAAIKAGEFDDLLGTSDPAA